MKGRDSTWDVRLGFDKLRWTDDEALVRQCYPAAKALPIYEGRDPRTGRAVTTNPGCVLEPGTFGVPIDLDGVSLVSSVTFDARGMAQITLSSDGGDHRYEATSRDEWQRMIAAAAGALGPSLGTGPVSPDDEDQTWHVGDVEVSLTLEWKRFGFTLTRLHP